MRVHSDALKKAAVILLGHGTKLNPDSATPVLVHSSALKARGDFGDVLPAFWKQEPFVKDVISSIACRTVVIVPMFISDGYFSDHVIPRELGFISSDRLVGRIETGGKVLHYARAVGTHPKMTDVVLSRARQVIQQFPAPKPLRPDEITLFIAGHGTSRSDKSRKSVEHQVELIKRSGIYADVHAIFMEEEPYIRDFTALARTKQAVIVPFFISDGLHVREDIPVMLGETEVTVRMRFAAGQATWRNPTEVQGILTWYSPAVGTDPGLLEVVIERVRECLRLTS